MAILKTALVLAETNATIERNTEGKGGKNIDIELPNKKYNTIVLDPPWEISMTGGVKRRENRKEKKYDLLDKD